jgi:hypothetical protein
MNRPRAADDFPAIRARMHELRRENTAASTAPGSSFQKGERRRPSAPIR